MYSLSPNLTKSVDSPNTSFIINGYEKMSEKLKEKSISPSFVYFQNINL